MNCARAFAIAGIVLTGIFASGVASAQAPPSRPATSPAPAASTPPASQHSTATRVETWTREQWDAAKKAWAKDKAKWAACRKRSRKQKLEGQKSWSFIYQCMTS
jgi:hypothetical protein